MRLLRFAARRVLLLIPVLLGVSALTFVLVRVLPGDPVRTIVPETATEADVAAARARYGLDRPLVTQYALYLGDLWRADFGHSFQSGAAVGDELHDRLGPTFELTTYALAAALVLGAGLGLASAVRAGSILDRASGALALAGNALPEFWLGLLLILLFYRVLGVAPPPSGRLGPGIALDRLTGLSVVDALLTWNLPALASALAHLALPVLTLVVVITAPLLRSVRAAAVDVLRSDAYQCAVAHGLPRGLLLRYLSREALIGLPTLAALVYGYLIGGVVLVEYVFSWQGFGQWALRGLLFRDYPVIQAFVLVTATVYLLVFLAADVLHAALDPRVRL